MAFKSKDLVAQVQVVQGEPYMFVVGCGALSVKCDHTQPNANDADDVRAFERQQPLDYEGGTITSATSDNLTSLKYELRTRLAQVEKALAGARMREGSKTPAKEGVDGRRPAGKAAPKGSRAK